MFFSIMFYAQFYVNMHVFRNQNNILLNNIVFAKLFI